MTAGLGAHLLCRQEPLHVAIPHGLDVSEQSGWVQEWMGSRGSSKLPDQLRATPKIDRVTFALFY